MLCRAILSGSRYTGVRSLTRGLYGNPHGWVEPLSGEKLRATTILCVRKDGKVAVVGDGQVSLGSQVVKPNATKVRRIGDGKVIVGFAGATADAMTLLERLEGKLEAHSNQLLRACVELAKDWRTEKYLRKLEAIMLVADKTVSLEVTGNGDVLEPHDDIIAIGSGGAYARAAAKALMHTDMSASEVADRAMDIASDMCVYTNKNFVRDELDAVSPEEDDTPETISPSLSSITVNNPTKPKKQQDSDSDSDDDEPQRPERN